jgi:hypothetical protein
MKPYPLASSNHFTVPVAIYEHLLAFDSRTGRKVQEQHDRTTLWIDRSAR